MRWSVYAAVANIGAMVVYGLVLTEPGQWLTTGVELIVTDRLPCATAQGSSITLRFNTTEPVREFRITFALASSKVTLRFSRFARNDTF